MNVNFYTFSKRKNSTNRPGSASRTLNCLLKDSCSILSPVLYVSTSEPSALNYAYIAEWGRYYYVTDWISDHDMWIAHLKIDVLATYRTQILNSRQYVLRSASKKNGAIPDTAYPITSQREVTSTYVENPVKLSGNAVDYVIGVLNFDETANSKINGIQYLVLTEAQMRAFINAMLTQNYFGLDPVLVALGFNASLLHAIVNPAQYIVESYMIPHSAMGSVSISGGKIGPWQLESISGSHAISSGYSSNVTSFTGTSFEIPSHPQTQTHGIYVNSSPYSHHVLHAGPFGDIPLDFIPSGVQANIKYTIKMDFKGDAQLLIMDDDLNLLASSYASLAVQIPIIATSDKSMQGMSTIGSEVKNGIFSMGTSLAGSQGRLTDAIVDMIPSIESTGVSAGVLSINQDWWLTSEYHYCAGHVIEGGEMASGKIGSPLCEQVLLSDLNGYTVCDNEIDISIAGYDSEIEEVKSYMRTGFFLDNSGG